MRFGGQASHVPAGCLRTGEAAPSPTRKPPQSRVRNTTTTLQAGAVAAQPAEDKLTLGISSLGKAALLFNIHRVMNYQKENKKQSHPLFSFKNLQSVTETQGGEVTSCPHRAPRGARVAWVSLPAQRSFTSLLPWA